MSLFRFNDKKSQKQIQVAGNYRNRCADQANADNIARYYSKRAQLTGSRDVWETEEAVRCSV